MNIKSFTFWRRIAILVLTVLMFARPVIGTNDSKQMETNLNIWFVVDATGSMVAKDINWGKRRYEQVKDDVKYIAEQIHGAKYGMVVQDFTTYLASPMSSSVDGIIAASAYVIPKISYYTSPTSLEELTTYSCKRISQYKDRYPDRKNVIVFMSDGEDVSETGFSSVSGLCRGVVDSAVVLGYGTTEGAKIEYVGYVTKDSDTIIREGDYIYYWPNTKNPNVSVDYNHYVISKINEENLKRIAMSMNGDYYHREQGDVPSSAITALSKEASTIYSESDSEVSVGVELYWVIAALLLCLMLIEGESTFTKILAEREGNHA